MRAASAFLLLQGAYANSDLKRARQNVPGEHVVGDDHIGMTVKLNKALRSAPDLTLKSCDEFAREELIELQRVLHKAREPSLELIYRETGDLGRRMGAFGKYSDDIQDLERFWSEEKAMLAKHPEMEQLVRDRKCHEVILWYVHHMSQTNQRELRKSLILPLLPERDFENESNGLFPPGGGLGCDTAHAKQTTAKNTEYVQWPEEVLYTATGHGAFPFWDSGGAGCSSCDPSVSNSAEIKTMYSGKLGSEIIMHASCGDMSWTGSSGAPNKSPCNHILTPDEGGFIYTPKTSLDKEADGKFCCRTVKAGSTVFTGAVPQDWMKQATYSGTYADFSGDHYSGPIKMFTWGSGQGLDFWYYTKPDGSPVQQGEGCQQPGGTKPTACASMLPIVLYHDWSSFANASFAASDFEVPSVCKTTSVSCAIPGDTSTIVV